MLNNLLNHNLLHITWLSNSLSPSLNATYSHGINKSTNFRFPQRLSVIFGFRRDYPPRKMASCRDCPCDLASSHCRKLFTKHNSLSRKQKIADSLGRTQIWRTVSVILRAKWTGSTSPVIQQKWGQCTTYQETRTECTKKLSDQDL